MNLDLTVEDIISSNDTVNYVEVVLAKKKYNEYVYDIHFDEHECGVIMQNLLDAFPKNKFFKKHTTKTIIDTLELTYCNLDHSEILHNLVLIHNRIHQHNGRTFLVNLYEKNILPSHCFPSSMNIMDIVDSKRLSMKITNNIYINIDSLQYLDGNVYIHIYININLKKSNDIAYITSVVNTIIKALAK